MSFARLALEGLILGNDNHIGDIGEYWARRYYEELKTFECYGTGKNAPFDLRLKDGTTVSVKTITAWSKTGYGTPVRPLDGKHWRILAAVYLAENLFPKKIAIVPIEDLLQRPVFVDNAARRSHATMATKSFPRFEWWPWLEDYEVAFSIQGDDLAVPRRRLTTRSARRRKSGARG